MQDVTQVMYTHCGICIITQLWSCCARELIIAGSAGIQSNPYLFAWKPQTIIFVQPKTFAQGPSPALFFFFYIKVGFKGENTTRFQLNVTQALCFCWLLSYNSTPCHLWFLTDQTLIYCTSIKCKLWYIAYRMSIGCSLVIKDLV